MKTLIGLIMTVLTTSNFSNGQTVRESVEQTVTQFVNASRDRDVHGMYYLLHERFQYFNNTEVLTKSSFMKLLGDGKSGGEDEKAEILFIEVIETSASVKLRTYGKSGASESFVHLSRNGLGAWQIPHILPYTYQKA
jgi:hypothetical protein